VVRKHSLYTAALFGWVLIVFASTVALFSGQAEPLVSPSMLPANGPFAMVGLAGGSLIVGAVVLTQLKRRAWRRAGRHAGLTAEGGGLFRSADLVGTEGERTVRARTIKRKTGGGESGTSKTTYTVVEADLREPATEGLLIARGNSSPTEVGELPLEMETRSVGEFAVVGGADELGHKVLSDRVQDALRQSPLLDTMLVGNASDVLLEAVPDGDGGLMGWVTDGIEDKLADHIPGDASTVRVETKGMLLDEVALERQVTAVATVADEFEAVTAR
jgi:hypothetical protein